MLTANFTALTKMCTKLGSVSFHMSYFHIVCFLPSVGAGWLNLSFVIPMFPTSVLQIEDKLGYLILGSAFLGLRFEIMLQPLIYSWYAVTRLSAVQHACACQMLSSLLVIHISTCMHAHARTHSPTHTRTHARTHPHTHTHSRIA